MPNPRSSDRYQCQAGFVQENNVWCRPCAEGKYCPKWIPGTGLFINNLFPGGRSACITCPAGKECHAYTYLDCTEGFYYNSGTCTECPTGSYCRNNVKTACSAGEYMPFKGFSFCLECPVQLNVQQLDFLLILIVQQTLNGLLLVQLLVLAVN